MKTKNKPEHGRTRKHGIHPRNPRPNFRDLATKVAITIPSDLYRALERTRRKNGQSRSAAVQVALRRWLQQRQEVAWDEEYIAAYRRHPETRREIAAARATSGSLLSRTEW